jgi:hypothetical protein
MWEKYPNVSSYVYCENNPIKFIDIHGLVKYLAITLGKDVFYRGRELNRIDKSVEHHNISNGIDGFLDVLKNATALDSDGIGFISIWSHGAAGMIFGENWRSTDNYIYSSDLNQLENAIDNEEVIFAADAVIFLGACNAGTDKKNAVSFAQKLANITGATVIAANDRVGPKDESKGNLIYSVSFPKKNKFFEFTSDGKLEIGSEINVVSLLEQVKQLQQLVPIQDIENKSDSIP